VYCYRSSFSIPVEILIVHIVLDPVSSLSKYNAYDLDEIVLGVFV